jgi:hypothetical protein
MRAVEQLKGTDELLWDYLDKESDERVLRIFDEVRIDGFHKAIEHKPMPVEEVAIKLLSMTLIKALALAAERGGQPNLFKSYSQLVEMHVKLIQIYMLKGMRPPR